MVRAGLLYQLRQTQRWEILPVITPTSQPLSALGSVIGMPAAQLTDFIDRVQAERVVLVVDQFEEVFALCKDDEQRQQFLATLLATVTRADNKFCLVVVIRADFFDKYSQHVDLAKQIQAHQIIVTPMTAAELEEAIVAPTQQVGLQIEPKLVSEMLADVKGALGSLPLLQYTLRELWTKCAPHRLLTFSAYEELGKITGTLEKGANGVYAQLSPPEQKTAQRIFIELTQLGEGTPDTRRQLSQQDLVTSLPFESAPVGEVIQKLVAANLVVTDKPKEEQVAIVNIAHEALIQHWGQLGGWLDENRDDIRFHRRLDQTAQRWNNQNKASGLLWRSPDLEALQDFQQRNPSNMTIVQKAFFEASVRGQLRTKKLIRFIIIALVTLTTVSGIGTYLSVQAERRISQARDAEVQAKLVAQRDRDIAQEAEQKAKDALKMAQEQKNKALFRESLFLAEMARQQIEQGDATTAVLLTLEALPKSIDNPNRPLVTEAKTQLYEAVSQLDKSVAKLTGQALIDHARKLVSNKELTQKQKKQFFLEERVLTLLELIEDIDPKFIETLTPEQYQKFAVNELDVLGKDEWFKWLEQRTPQQIIRLKHYEITKAMINSIKILSPPESSREVFPPFTTSPDVVAEAYDALNSCLEKRERLDKQGEQILDKIKPGMSITPEKLGEMFDHVGELGKRDECTAEKLFAERATLNSR
ncbi:hypothetical protein [Candidatus Parabeggiatoa sp. HSG14]|uniref:nSTAND1 domain-containing NTPase n=1 Tax=Candidatus Parabeggiatoa sp. HSG14 TaxID=3055593 RepID=UPI0025A8FABA|nr:hypothetical protein [Thiotrichales bacterium HSG14]